MYCYSSHWCKISIFVQKINFDEIYSNIEFEFFPPKMGLLRTWFFVTKNRILPQCVEVGKRTTKSREKRRWRGKAAYLLMNFKSALLHFSCQITQGTKRKILFSEFLYFFGLLSSNIALIVEVRKLIKNKRETVEAKHNKWQNE